MTEYADLTEYHDVIISKNRDFECDEKIKFSYEEVDDSTIPVMQIECRSIDEDSCIKLSRESVHKLSKFLGQYMDRCFFTDKYLDIE